jgi:hypothetical protein
LLSRRSTRGGDLVSTAGDVQLVRVDLTEKHRAYLFPSALSSGTALGETAISLPFNDSATTTRLVRTDESNLRGARVYDIGECSYTMRWETVGFLFKLQLNSFLSGSSLIRDVVVGDTAVQPTLRSTPRFASATLGTEDAADELRIATTVTGRVTERISCNFRLDIEPVIRIGSGPAVRDPVSTVQRDQVMRLVGCEPTATGFSCRVPLNPDGTGPLTRINYTGDP